MKPFLRRGLPALILIILIIALSSCSDREEADKQWESGSYGDASGAVRITGVEGGYGDVQVQFLLNLPEGSKQDVVLYYQGACAGTEDWIPVLTSGDVSDLAAGSHNIVWHSWDHEAGCAGDVTLRLEIAPAGDSHQKTFALDNTRDGQTGFFEMPLLDQGINGEEQEYFEAALSALLNDESVDFVATRFGDDYEVYAERGSVIFERLQDRDGYHYEIVEVEGENPIENQDPEFIGSYAEELAAGSNPNGASVPGYAANDERLSFIEPENDSYPFGYERIAAFFDNPDSADFMINMKGYAHYDHNLGTHGSLNYTQSRCPLIFWGAGVEPGAGEGLHARQVDIAPTVGRLMGMEKTLGVDERGIWSNDVYLGWQDGRVIEEVLSGEKSQRVIIIVSDGLTLTEILRQIEQNPESVPNFRRLIQEGASLEYGAVANWPSVTYPSHNVIGAGVYSGHHGLVDNAFYYRDEHERATPISQLVFTDPYFKPIGPVETIHQAIHRNFGKWKRIEGKGAFTVSLLDPSVRGADKADIEFRDSSWRIPFPPFGLYWPPEVPGPSPALMGDMSVWGEQLLVSMAFVELYHCLSTEYVGPAKYVILDLMTTDGAGHAYGPHGDKMDVVMAQADENLGVLFHWLEIFGLDHGTTIIFTSDHGMQIGDPTRSSWPTDTLDAAGIKYVPVDDELGVYLKVMAAGFDVQELTLDREQRVGVYVEDEDDGAPLQNVMIHAADGAVERIAHTDINGLAEFYITPRADVQITITHDDFNTVRRTLSAS